MFNTTPFYGNTFRPKAWYEKSISDFCESAQGAELLAFCNAASGVNYPSLEYYVPRAYEQFYNPLFGVASSHTSNGLSLGTATGTAVSKSLGTTNSLSYERRVRYKTTTTSAGELCGLRAPSTELTQIKGYVHVSRFGCSDTATVSGARQFCGVGPALVPTNVDPSTLTDSIAIVNRAVDSNMQILYGGSSAQPLIDLGDNFPANTLSSDLYELLIIAPKDLTTKVGVQVRRIGTSYAYRAILSATTEGVELPSTTTGIVPYRFWRTNNATALEAGIDICSIYVGKGAND